MENRTLEQFTNDVKAKLNTSLKCFNLTEEELDAFVDSEKETIEADYKSYQKGFLRDDDLTDEAYYKSCVAGTAQCLELCYE